MSVFSYNQPENRKRPHTKLRVIVFDQCPLFRQALVELLNAQPAFTVTQITDDAQIASDPEVLKNVDFVVIDLDAGVEGLGVLEKIKAGNLRCRCVMLITDGARTEMMAAIRMQADGFLSKRLTANEFIQQFEQIADGNMVISDSLTNALAVTLRNVPYPDDTRDISVLSPREIEVLTCISAGMSNRQIADRLAISDGTVKVHVKHVLKKLSFSTRVEAALWASQNGHGVN